MLNGLDLFSGIGGLSIALEDWVRTTAYCEIDRYAQGVLLSRMQSGEIDSAPIWSDIKTLNAEVLGEIVVAGRLKKLTPEQVDMAVKWYEEGSSLADLAHEFSVSRQSMHDLLKRRIKLRPQQRFGKDNHFFRGGSRADKKAHDIMEDAIKRGLLVNPEQCSECGFSGRFSDGRTAVQGHHDDYNFPLNVRWLCQRCHHEWHKNNVAIERREGNGSCIDIIVGGFP